MSRLSINLPNNRQSFRYRNALGIEKSSISASLSEVTSALKLHSHWVKRGSDASIMTQFINYDAINASLSHPSCKCIRDMFFLGDQLPAISSNTADMWQPYCSTRMDTAPTNRSNQCYQS